MSLYGNDVTIVGSLLSVTHGSVESAITQDYNAKHWNSLLLEHNVQHVYYCRERLQVLITRVSFSLWVSHYC